MDLEWAITLQQFLAFTLVEKPFEDFFGSRTDISERIAKLRHQRLRRTQSLNEVSLPAAPIIVV